MKTITPTLDRPLHQESPPPEHAEQSYDALLERGWELRARPATRAGVDSLIRQHHRGRMTVWERIETLQDRDARPTVFWQNWGEDLSGASIATLVTRVGGRDVAVYGHDFTLRAGSMDGSNGRKLAKLIQLAGERGLPLVGLNDSAGAYVPAGVGGLDGYAEAFVAMRRISGIVPSIQCMFGFNAGGGAYLPRQSSFIIQSGETFFGLTGPGVVKQVLGEDVTADQLGGPAVHAASGVADLSAPDEISTLRLARKLLAYLPGSSREMPPRLETGDPPGRRTTEIDTLLRKAFTSPTGFNTPLDTSILIERLCDRGDFLDLQPDRARNAITALGRLGGHVVGFIANNSAVASGQMDVDASLKIARFVRFCSIFNIPTVFVEDTTGFLPGREQEARGAVQAGRSMLDAIIDLRTPRILLIVRNAFGGAYAAFNSHVVGADLVLALPTARVAVMGSAGKDYVYKDELKQVRKAAREQARELGEEEAKRWLTEREAEFSQRYTRELMNPDHALSVGAISSIVHPHELREVLSSELSALLRSYSPGPIVGPQREFH